LTSVSLLLVKTFGEKLIGKSDTDEAGEVRFIPSESQACLILKHRLVVVHGRCHCQATLSHNVHVLRFNLSVKGWVVYVSLEDWHQIQARLALVI
jgi:hypothetical protein